MDQMKKNFDALGSALSSGNLDDAKKAFAGLKGVPNISPRVLRLWELYAETLAR